MNNKIGLPDVKLALKDDRFLESLPKSFAEDIAKYKRNPGCGCNISFYKKILKYARDELTKYFPGKEIDQTDDDVSILSKNNFSVINCRIDQLEATLKKLPPGRKQLAIARYEDQVTVVINDLEIVY